MIDDKTILQWELDAEEAGLTQHAEIIRNARRYLAGREREVKSIAAAIARGECEYISAQDIRAQLDAAADRLLEGGE